MTTKQWKLFTFTYLLSASSP